MGMRARVARGKVPQEAPMARFSLRTAFTALALGVAALGASTLAPSEASAKGFHGGGFHGGGW